MDSIICGFNNLWIISIATDEEGKVYTESVSVDIGQGVNGLVMRNEVQEEFVGEVEQQQVNKKKLEENGSSKSAGEEGKGDEEALPNKW